MLFVTQQHQPTNQPSSTHHWQTHFILDLFISVEEEEEGVGNEVGRSDNVCVRMRGVDSSAAERDGGFQHTPHMVPRIPPEGFCCGSMRMGDSPLVTETS